MSHSIKTKVRGIGKHHVDDSLPRKGGAQLLGAAFFASLKPDQEDFASPQTTIACVPTSVVPAYPTNQFMGHQGSSFYL
jgi:hypothetical protein